MSAESTIIDSLLGIDIDKSIGALERKAGATPLDPSQRKVAVALSNAKVKKALQQDILDPVQKFFISKLGELNRQTVIDINSGKKKMFKKAHYLRMQLTQSANTRLLDTIVEHVRGVRSFKDNVLSKTEPSVIYGLKVAYGKHASSTEPGAVHYTNASDAEDAAGNRLPEGLINGDLIFTGGSSNNIIYDGPVKNFFRDTLAKSEKAQQEDFVPVAPLIVLANEPIGVEYFGAKTASNATTIAFPAGNHFIEVNWFTLTLK